MKIHVFSKLPPPTTGQTIGTKIVCEFLENTNHVYQTYNISASQNLKKQKFNFIYTYRLLLKFFKQLIILRRNLKCDDIVYFIPSSSFSGVLKDVVFCSLLKKDIKLVAHVRSGNLPFIYENYFFKIFTNFVISKVTLYIFLSKNLCNAVKRIPDFKKTYVSNPIDNQIVSSADEITNKLIEIRNRKSQYLNIIFISNMIKSKGYDDLLESANFLKNNKDINFNFIFIGSWRDEIAKKKFFSKISEVNKIKNINCEYLGYINDRKLIKDYLKSSDIFCLPTYYPVEAQPRSIIEAMSNGLPIISTNHASIPEVVKHNFNGLLIDPKSPKSIAKAIIFYSKIKNLIEHSSNSFEIYNSLFSQKKLLTILINKIKNVKNCKR